VALLILFVTRMGHDSPMRSFITPQRKNWFALIRASIRWNLSVIDPLVKPPGSRLRSVRNHRWKPLHSEPLRPNWVK
jgi:hypothetical protein